MSKKVVVIGGGLAGTSAAHALVEQGYDVTIVEKEDRLGGRIHSKTVDGAAVEMGAGFMTSGYTNLLGFLRASGLEQQLYRQQSISGIYRDGGVRMATPRILMGSAALSWGAKLQALTLLGKTITSWQRLDPHAFWKAALYDNQSVAGIAKSESAKEFLEYVLQPILNGYFYWTPEHTSEAMMRILCKVAFSHGTFRMKGGLQRIPEKAAEGSKLLLGHQVKRAERTADGPYSIVVDNEGTEQILHADGIIVATTASAVAGIFPGLTQRQREFFNAIRYSSGALIARTYLQAETLGDKAIAFPRKEGIELASVTLSPEPGSNNSTYAAVKAYASGTAAPSLIAMTDSELEAKLIGDMEPVRDSIFNGSPHPVATYTQRWPEALPYFDVGHFKRLGAFEDGEIEDQSRPIAFAGDYIGGPFMEGAYTSGVRAAERLDSRLRH